jgi:hypothetical protein
LREVNNDLNIRIAIKQVVPLVRTLQQRGTRVIMYNPTDPRIAKISPMKDLKAAIRVALPDVEYIDPPDDKLPHYRTGGLHLVGGSGVLLFNHLMERAGLPSRSPYQVRSSLLIDTPRRRKNGAYWHAHLVLQREIVFCAGRSISLIGQRQ